MTEWSWLGELAVFSGEERQYLMSDLTRLKSLCVCSAGSAQAAGFGGDGHEGVIQVQDELVELMDGVMDVQRQRAELLVVFLVHVLSLRDAGARRTAVLLWNDRNHRLIQSALLY